MSLIDNKIISKSVQHEPPETPDPLLTSILRTRRADGSAGDTNFRLWLHGQLRAMNVPIEIGQRGNIIVVTDPKSDTLFSCHIDTCHSQTESNGQSQDIIYDPIMGQMFLDGKSNAGCLGADDGAGIYIMLKLIDARVSGTFVFHTGEERGGLGAHELLKSKREWLDQFSRAIAFDRPNNDEVIVSQGGMRCASDQAGEALCEALNEWGMTYHISHRGVFTDTKVYAGVIPECFNLGVGYYDQHSPNETLDVAHLEALLNACFNVDFDALPVMRSIPVQPVTPIKPKVTAPPFSMPVSKTFPSLFDELKGYSKEELIDICEQTPEEAAFIIIKLIAENEGKKAELASIYNSLGVA